MRHLRASEARKAAIVLSALDAIVTIDSRGRVVEINPAAVDLFGYSAEEMIGSNIRILIPDDLQAEEDEILAKLPAGEYLEHYETLRMRKSGEQVAVSLSISPVMDPSGAIVGAAKIARDITPRRQAEAALAAATAKF